VAYFHLQQYDQSLANVAKALETNPNDTSALWWIPLSLVSECADEPFRKGLLELADRAVEKSSIGARALRDRAAVLEALEKYEEAEADLRKIIELEPDDKMSWDRHVRLSLRPEQLQKAESVYSELVKTYSDNYLAWVSRAAINNAHSRYDEAIANATKSIELKPSQTRAYRQCAIAYFHLKRYDDALAEMQSHYKRKPNDAGVIAWIPADQVRECPEEIFRKGLFGLADQVAEKTTKPARARQQRLTLFLGMNEFGKARAEYELVLKPNNRSFSEHYRHALLCLQENEHAQYRESCQRMLSAFVDTPNLMAAQFVAWTCTLAPNAVEDFDQPIALAAKAIQGDAGSDQFQNTLGATLYRSGRNEEALRILTTLVERMEKPDSKSSPSPAYTWYFLAMAHHKAGNNDEAVQWLKRANDWTDNALADKDTPPQWNRKITLELLRKEAEALVKNKNQESEDRDQKSGNREQEAQSSNP